MITQQKPTAPRFRKPGLKDPRLLAGILLIVVSVLGVAGIIRVTNQTSPFYVATRDIERGEAITADNLATVHVNLGESASQYLSAEQVLDEGSLAARPVKAGELLTTQTIAIEKAPNLRLVTLLLDHYAVASYQAGDRVDIWVSHKAEGGNNFHDPEPIAMGAEINTVKAQESVIGGTGKSAVELWVNEENMPAVLAVTNNGSAINLVPASLSGE